MLYALFSWCQLLIGDPARNISWIWPRVRQSTPVSDSFLVATTTASAATWHWTRLTPLRAQVCQMLGGIGLEESTASTWPAHSSSNAAWDPLLRTLTVTPL